MGIDFYVNIALAILFQAIKNPQKNADFKKALRKLRDVLVNAQLDD